LRHPRSQRLATQRLIVPIVIQLARGVVAAVVLLTAPAAWAQPTETDRESAREFMAKGRDARSNDDIRQALQHFRSADEIMHVPTTSLEVAKAQADLGMLVEARLRLVADRTHANRTRRAGAADEGA
jgi:hypothetical protein